MLQATLKDFFAAACAGDTAVTHASTQRRAKSFVDDLRDARTSIHSTLMGKSFAVARCKPHALRSWPIGARDTSALHSNKACSAACAPGLGVFVARRCVPQPREQ